MRVPTSFYSFATSFLSSSLSFQDIIPLLSLIYHAHAHEDLLCIEDYKYNDTLALRILTYRTAPYHTICFVCCHVMSNSQNDSMTTYPSSTSSLSCNVFIFLFLYNGATFFLWLLVMMTLWQRSRPILPMLVGSVTFSMSVCFRYSRTSFVLSLDHPPGLNYDKTISSSHISAARG